MHYLLSHQTMATLGIHLLSPEGGGEQCDGFSTDRFIDKKQRPKRPRPTVTTPHKRSRERARAIKYWPPIYREIQNKSRWSRTQRTNQNRNSQRNRPEGAGIQPREGLEPERHNQPRTKTSPGGLRKPAGSKYRTVFSLRVF